MHRKLDYLLVLNDFGHDAQLHDASEVWRSAMSMDFGGIAQQVDQHLLDQDRVHHQQGQARGHIMV
jgi:hypothetical protein